MAVFEKFAKGSIKHYNRFSPKKKKKANLTLIKFWLVFIIDSKTVLYFFNAENGLKNHSRNK